MGFSRLVYSSIASKRKVSFVLPMENIFTLYIYWDPPREIFSFNLPFLNRPLLWYGFFFTLGFVLGYLIFFNLLKSFFRHQGISANISKLIEQIGFYVILGTIIGARLGDVLFYQNWQVFVHDPLALFRFWEGGLASHGGISGVMISIALFCRRIKTKYPQLSWLQMTDLLVIPACIVAGCIRVGNFFNQEILGTATKMPWGVLFGHPADGSRLTPLHPVQIYEAFFYVFLFFILHYLHRKEVFFTRGKMTGLFFISAFSFRFFIEFFKTHQSLLLPTDSVLDMGQVLSIPFVLFGGWLLFRKKQQASSLGIEGN